MTTKLVSRKVALIIGLLCILPIPVSGIYCAYLNEQTIEHNTSKVRDAVNKAHFDAFGSTIEDCKLHYNCIKKHRNK